MNDTQSVPDALRQLLNKMSFTESTNPKSERRQLFVRKLPEILNHQGINYNFRILKPQWGGIVIVYWNHLENLLLAAVSGQTLQEARGRMEKTLKI